MTVDQTDIVANQVKNTNQTSAFIQTDDVLLFSNTQEFLSYYSQAMKEQPTPNTTSAEIPSDANKHNKTCATTQTQTQPSIIFSQLSKGTKEMSTQTPDTPESTSTIEKKLEELLNTQNTILQMLRRQNDGNISDILNLTNSIPDLLDNNEPDQQSIVKYIIKYPSSEETKQQSDVNNQTAVSSDILSSAAESSDEETFLPPMTRPRKTATQPAQSTAFGPDDILSSTLQAIQTLACKTVIPTTTPSMQPSSSESIVSTDISPTTVSISQMQSLTGTSAPLPTTLPCLLPLVETHPISISNLSNMSNGRPSKEVSWRKTKTITKCFSGALLEIVSPADLLPALADTEVRIKPDKVRTTMSDSVSARNFGWNLVKMLFSPQEIIGRNFWGNKGKIPLSPRRRHAIEHAIIDTYGQENLQTCITGINTGIRNFRSER